MAIAPVHAKAPESVPERLCVQSPASATGSAAGWRSTQRAKERRRRHTAIVNSTTLWPEWKAAKPGQRVRMNRTGWTGTVVNVNRFGVRVRWDQSGYEGVVVAPAFDLTPI